MNMQEILDLRSALIDDVLTEVAKSLSVKKGQRQSLFGGLDYDPEQSFGRFLLAIQRKEYAKLDEMGSRFIDWENESHLDQKASMAVQTGTVGGFTVPQPHIDAIYHASENAVVRPRATIIEMRSQTAEIPSASATGAPASSEDTARYGGLKAHWTEETTVTQSEPTFKGMTLNARQLAGNAFLSNALFHDLTARGLEQSLLAIIGECVAWYEDHAFLRGNGVGKPLGILNWPGLITVTRSGANAFTLADAATMLSRLLPTWSPDRTCWACHPTLVVKLFQIAATATGSVQVTRTDRGPRMTFLGLDVVITDKLPTLNTVGDVLLLDCSRYVIGDRQQLSINFSPHARFTTNQGVWRFVTRVDGRPWLDNVMTLPDGTNTVSPFIALAAGA